MKVIDLTYFDLVRFLIRKYYNGIFSMYLLKLFSGSGKTNVHVYNYFYLLEKKNHDRCHFFLF